MSLNCSSGLFFIPGYLIIKGRKRFCCRRTDSSCQFSSLSSPKTGKYIYKVCLFLPRRCCSISNVCGLFVYYIWATIRRRIFCMPLCFFFNEDIAKKYEKERKPFALVIGQKRKCDAHDSSGDSCGPSVRANCRRFEYLILQ